MSAVRAADRTKSGPGLSDIIANHYRSRRDHWHWLGSAGRQRSLAWIYRRRFPLASYGWFVFLILLAPDILLRARSRIRWPSAACIFPSSGSVHHRGISAALENIQECTASGALSLVLVVEGSFTYQTKSAVGLARSISGKTRSSKSPQKLRPRFQLAFAPIFKLAIVADAVDEFQKGRRAGTSEVRSVARLGAGVRLRWKLAAGHRETAAGRGPRHPNAHVYSQIGMEYGKMGKYPEALDALATAQRTGSQLRLDDLCTTSATYSACKATRRRPRKTTGARWRSIRNNQRWRVKHLARTRPLDDCASASTRCTSFRAASGAPRFIFATCCARWRRSIRINQYIVFTNRETGADLVPGSTEFRHARSSRVQR